MDIIALAKRIEEELQITDSVDTLGRWMSHYIAELITQCETATDIQSRSEAEKECAELIIGLWEHRQNLPHQFRPLANIEKILEGITKLQEEPNPWLRDEELSNPWINFANKSKEINHRIAAISVLMAIAESKFDKTKRWLEETSDALSKEEKEIIEALDCWLNHSNKLLPWNQKNGKTSIASLDPIARFDLVQAELEKMLHELNDEFTKLKDK